MPSRSSPSVRVFYPRWTREGLVKHLRAKLPLLAQRLPLVRVVLFGSYAKGKFTVASDIDLLIVYDREHRDDAYAVTLKTLNVPRLEPHMYWRAECAAAQPTVKLMERGGIVLFDRTEGKTFDT